jgi:ERCC4-type nuclease
MILVDDRIGSRDLEPLITVPSKLTRLTSGDASFLGYGPDGHTTIGVERKKLRDLINSMTTGRLSGVQLVNMARHYQYFYIVLEGIWRINTKTEILEDWKRGKWSKVKLGDRVFTGRELHNFCNTLSIVCKIPIVRTGTAKHTALWLGDVWHWWQKRWGDHRSHRAKHMQPGIQIDVSTSRLNLVARVAQEMQGVGAVRANAIGKAFNSIHDLVRAGAEDIAAVPVSTRSDGAVVHVGPVVAQRVVEQIQGG